MSIYNFDFGNFWDNNLPPDHRGNRMKAWGRALLKPLQWLRDIIFGSYADGDDTSPDYDPLASYSVTDRVKFGKSIYECWTATTPGILPTDINYFVLVQSDFTGARQRAKQTAEKLNFEFALNQWFETTFNQPPTLSDIYITNNNIYNESFFVGLTETESSNAVFENGVAENFVQAENVSSTGQAHFTINIPVAVYTALGPDATTRERTVRQFADKINLAGMRYDIVTY